MNLPLLEKMALVGCERFDLYEFPLIEQPSPRKKLPKIESPAFPPILG